jgi:hypothetical protein
MKYYWTDKETEALREYQQADTDRRNQIFEETLLTALNKLAECMINMSSIYKSVDLNQLRYETITHMSTYLDRVDCNKSAFGYLQLCCKHFIFQSTAKQHRLDHQAVSLNLDKDNDDGEYLDPIENQILDMTDPSVLDGVSDVDALKSRVLAYWDVPKLKKHIWSSRIKQKRQTFNRCCYYLYRLGSPHIPKSALVSTLRDNIQFSHRIASEALAVLSKASNELLD